jgi:hypothetical protein
MGEAFIPFMMFGRYDDMMEDNYLILIDGKDGL